MHFVITTNKYILISIFLFAPFVIFSQKRITSNPYVKYEVNISEEKYFIEYTFKDQFNNFQQFTLGYPLEITNHMIDRFGVPNWMFNEYHDTWENRLKRKNILKEGLFRLENNVIEADKSAVIIYYSEIFCKPVAGLIADALAGYGKDTRRNRIEMAIRFVQDIPYGIPEFSDKDRHYGGVSPPPELLINGYGDCDSKVLLFAGILIYLIDSDDIIFLNQSKHVLTAIKEEPDKGSTYIKYKKEKYLIAETAGPGLRSLGEKGNYYKNSFKVEELNINPPEIIPYSNNKPEIAITNNDNSLIIKNVSGRSLRFQISTGNNQWNTMYLDANNTGKFDFQEKGMVTIKTRNKNMKFTFHQLEIGSTYSFFWDNKKRQWDIL